MKMCGGMNRIMDQDRRDHWAGPRSDAMGRVTSMTSQALNGAGLELSQMTRRSRWAMSNRWLAFPRMSLGGLGRVLESKPPHRLTRGENKDLLRQDWGVL